MKLRFPIPLLGGVILAVAVLAGGVFADTPAVEPIVMVRNIAAGLPVDASIGLTDSATLKTRLEDAKFQSSFVLVGWEHVQIVQLARAIMSDFGADPGSAPQRKGSDFDGIYVIRVTRGGAATAAFERREEGLNNGSTVCQGQ